MWNCRSSQPHQPSRLARMSGPASLPAKYATFCSQRVQQLRATHEACFQHIFVFRKFCSVFDESAQHVCVACYAACWSGFNSSGCFVQTRQLACSDLTGHGLGGQLSAAASQSGAPEPLVPWDTHGGLPRARPYPAAYAPSTGSYAPTRAIHKA